MSTRKRTLTAASWSVFVFGFTVTGVVACGGIRVYETLSEAGAEVGSPPNEASGHGPSCPLHVDCDGGAESGSSDRNGGSLTVAETAGDGAIALDGGVLCGYYTGPIAQGSDAGGPAIPCYAGWACVNLNGGWACCTPGRASLCNLPLLPDGG